MRQLTERQKMILDYISDSIYRLGYPPTLREIGEYMNISSVNGVNDHLKALERKGFISREGMKSRTLRLVKTESSPFEPVDLSGRFVEVPVVGRVAAGQPVLALENVEDRVLVDRFFIGTTKKVFALKVQGESMIGAGINDGDYLFVKNQPNAERGDIVIAMIDNEATVKRFYPGKNEIRFVPENSEMEPIVVKRSEFKDTQILGVVVGVYRKM